MHLRELRNLLLGPPGLAAALLGGSGAFGAEAPVRSELRVQSGEPAAGIWLGVLLMDVPDGGVEIVDVVRGSPAALSGLLAGDLVVQVAGRPTPTRKSLRRALATARPGEPFRLVVVRNGSAEELTIVAGARPERPYVPLFGEGFEPHPRLRNASDVLSGLELARIGPELRRHLGSTPDVGVLIASIAPGTPAQRAGLRVGDLLLKAAGTPLRGPDDVRLAVIAGSPRAVSFEVFRRGAPRPLEVRIPIVPSLEPGRAREARALDPARVRELESAIARLKAQLAVLEAELERLGSGP